MWPIDRITFDTNLQCLAGQYDAIEVDKNENGSPYFDKGLQTLEENFADNLGLKASYYAWLKWKLNPCHLSENFGLAGMQHFSEKQMFFLSYAHGFCTTQHKVENKKQLKSGGKMSPGIARVIGALHNMDEFGNAFNCAAGTRKNALPSQKCKLY